MPRVVADIESIEHQLKEFGNGTPFKLRTVNNLHATDGSPIRLKIRETDTRVDIKVNPKKIRTQAQLDEVLHECLESLGGQR